MCELCVTIGLIKNNSCLFNNGKIVCSQEQIPFLPLRRKRLMGNCPPAGQHGHISLVNAIT